MEKHEEFFTSEHVDEQIEQRNGDLPAASDAQFLSEMQQIARQMREEQGVSLRRVEDRLMKHALTRAVYAASAPSEQQQRSSAARAIQQGRFNRMEKKQASKFGRRVSMLVAVLITAILVGSLVAVLGLTHRPTNTGNRQVGTPTVAPTQLPETPTPTPTAPPPSGPANQGQIVYTSPASTDDFYALAWSPDSQRIASSTNGQVQIWDAMTGEHQLTFTPLSTAYGLSWSPKGRYLAVTSVQVQIINPLTGAVVRTFPSSLALSGMPGSHLSAARPLSSGGGVSATAWSPDGTLMATALNGTTADSNVVDVWNVSTGQILYTFKGQAESGVSSLSWSSDGKYVASASVSTDGTVQVWNALTGQVIFSQPFSDASVVWAPTGMRLAFADGGYAQIWNVATNTQLVDYTPHFTSSQGSALSWSPDGKEIADSDGNDVVILDASTGQKIYTFTDQGGIYIPAVAWSPNGKYIVSGSGSSGENGSYGANYAKVWIA